MASLVNPRPLRWLALAGMLAVMGATLSSFLQRTRERPQPRPAPPRIAPQVSQQTHAFSLSKSLGDHTLYTVEADEVTHFKNKVVLRGVSILLYGEQGDRRDRIESQECEFDPATGSLSISGEVTMQLGIPEAGPGQATNGARDSGLGTRPNSGTWGSSPESQIPNSESRISNPDARNRNPESGIEPAEARIPAGVRDRGADSSGPLPGGRASEKPPVAYAPGSDRRGADSVMVRTTGLKFDQKTGIASTDQEVRFWFAQGQGIAKGAVYDPQAQQLSLRSAVEFFLREPGPDGPEPPAAKPPSHGGTEKLLSRGQEFPVLSRSSPGAENDEGMTHVRAASLRFQRAGSTIYLGGPVELTREARRLQAGDSEILLDGQRRARRVRLGGGVAGVEQSVVRPGSPQEGRSLKVQARRAVLELTEPGKLRSLQLEEEVAWVSSFAGSQREGRAQQVELSFSEPAGLLDRMVASRDVQIVLRDSGRSATPSANSTSLPARRGPGSRGPVLGAGTQTLSAQEIEMTMAPDGQTLGRVATHSPATLELAPSGAALQGDAEQWRVAGQAFEMGFDGEGNLSQFAAEGEVRMVAEPWNGRSAGRISSSDHLSATLDPRARSIARLEQWGHYRYQDSEKQTRAERAEYSGESDTIVLQGEAALWDSNGKLLANQIVFDNATGNIQAEGKLSTTYFPKPSRAAPQSDPTHVVAERMNYDAAASKAQYESHVRLWQGNQLLEADWVELDRRQSQLEARGQVYTVFPQPPPRTPKAPASRSTGTERTGSTGKTVGTELTEIRSEQLLYQQAERRALYRGGVRMRSASLGVNAGALELFFESAGTELPGGSGQMQRAVASQQVRIVDSARKGTGDRAEYLPGEATVDLFGKPAVVEDPQQGRTQGVRLTYRMGDDRIRVEGEPGLPAETRRQIQR